MQGKELESMNIQSLELESGYGSKRKLLEQVKKMFVSSFL